MADSSHIRVAKEYFIRVDAGRKDVLDLFTKDFEFYFPKYGIGVGSDALMAFGAVLMNAVRSISHDLSKMTFIEGPSSVVVEGVSRGFDADGREWIGGETPGGRFCSVFIFEDDLIKRKYVYLDPDYTGRHEAGFRWGMDRRW